MLLILRCKKNLLELKVSRILSVVGFPRHLSKEVGVPDLEL